MPVSVSEDVSRFLGYLHFDQLLNLHLPHYAGAPIYSTHGYAPEHVGASVDRPIELPGRPAQPRAGGVQEAAEEIASFRLGPSVSLKILQPPSLVTLPQGFVAPQTAIDAAFNFPIDSGRGPINPSVTYTFGETAGRLFSVRQLNELFDSDVVIDSWFSAGALPVPPETQSELDALVELARAQLPAGFGPTWEQPAGIDRGPAHPEIELNSGREQSSSDAVRAFAVPPNGTYVDGVRVSDTGQSQPEQSADLTELSKTILDEGKFGDDRGSAFEPEGVPIPEGGLPFGPTGGAVQVVASGGNELANIAAIYDLTDANGSRIILGDYHERNVIAQVNVLAETLNDLPSERELLEAVAHSRPGSGTGNEASFVADPGVLFGNVAAGFPGATKWHVDYIQGDVIDITSVVQRNGLTDNDIGQSTMTRAHSIYTLGDNDQINVLNLVELGKAYDLMIIGGDVFKYNAIIQLNVVLDANAITQSSSKSQIDAMGNRLTNDAAIVGIGGDTHIPLSDNAAALAGAIANESTTLDFEWTIGLPGNGNDTFEVLYISGDYFTYNVIVQTNTIADVDIVDQQGNMVDELDQQASADGNAASNAALILDAQSQSSYQYLDGVAYEETFLVQANIIVDPEEDNDGYNNHGSGSTDDSSLIGVLAALNDQDATSDTSEGGENYGGVMGGSTDVLGSMLQ